MGHRLVTVGAAAVSFLVSMLRLSLLWRREDRLDPEQKQTLGETLDLWKDEITRMWRLRKNNGITEGFHNKMEMISRRAFGFKNVDNYRLRARACC